MGSKSFAGRSAVASGSLVGNNEQRHLHFHLSILRKQMRKTTPCAENQFRTYTTSWRPLPQPLRCGHIPHMVIESLKGHFISLSSRLLQNKHGTISEYHEHRPIVIFHLLLNELLDKQQCCGIPQWWTRHFAIPCVVILSESLHIDKTNLYSFVQSLSHV